jgi:PAS domain S-box-containing protein
MRIPTLINARQKRDLNGVPVLNRFTIFNATERRTYERDLLAARDLFQTTLASIGDGVIATDAEGRISFMNPVAEKLSGWTEESAAGKPIEEILQLVREDSGERIENPVTHALRTGEIVGLENHTVLISKGGRQITVDDSASPIRDANGYIVGGVLVFRDVSDRRKTQKGARRSSRRAGEEFRRASRLE